MSVDLGLWQHPERARILVALGPDGFGANVGGVSSAATGRGLRVVHCPVNVAGIPWANVAALRRQGVDARLVVFNRATLHPEADWSLDRHGPLPQRLATQAAALARLLPQTDVFHFYFGLTLVPKRVQFPLLRATRRKSVMHWLGSDIRGRTPAALAFGRRAGAQIVGSYDAIRWVPEAHVVPPGLDLGAYTPRPPSDAARPLVVHTPSNRAKKGTAQVIEACARLPVELEIVEGVPHDEARERYARRATAETLVDVLRPLVEDAALRRSLGAESRAYVEQVHDIDRVADRLLAVYRSL